jgi:hypothetical protein
MPYQIKKHALLIGIDCYKRDPSKTETPRVNVHGKKIVYRDLQGSVNDALAVRHFLINNMGVENSNITMLLAPVPGRKHHLGLPEGQYKEPTYENIIRALVQLAMEVKSGDLVYIHYSGHGGHATTVFSELKHDKGAEDHSIVPSDIICGGKYLRDVEIGALLQDIVKKEVILTVVLDSCYSGGALRDDDNDEDDEDAEEDTRGISPLYQSDRDVDFPTDKDILASIGRWGTVDNWMQAPRGFVVLTACQDHEKAKEMFVFKNGPRRKHGVLTHWLLDTIRTNPQLLSSDAVYNRVCATIVNNQKEQTPHIIGDRDRFFFDSKFRPRFSTLPVRASATRHSLVLGGGAVDCIRAKSVYSILPIEFDFSQQITQNDILARVQIKTVRAVESTADFLGDEVMRWQEIREGCHAVLYNLPIESQSTVKFWANDDSQLLDFRKEFDDACANSSAAWLRYVDDDAVFNVKVAENGSLEIDDQAGLFTTHIAEHLQPIEWNDEDRMSRLVIRLSHLARFKLIKGLDNPGFRENSLANLISVDVGPAPSEICGNGYPPVTEMTKDKGIYKVPLKSWFQISIKNNTKMNVGVVIFNLTLDFEIGKVFPKGEPYRTLAPGATACGPLYVDIPSHLADLATEDIPFVDIFKVFVSVPPKDLNSLEMDSLVDKSTRDDETELEDSLSNLDGILEELSPLTRHGYSPESMEGDWHTFDIRVEGVS